MIRLLQAYRLLWISGLVLLLLSFGLEAYYLNQNTDIQRFKSSLRQKENLADKTLPVLETEQGIQKFAKTRKPELQKDKIIYLVYEDKELIYWSNNLINIPEVYENSLYSQALLKLNNAYYAVRKYNHQNKKMVALIPVYYEYNTPNSYLENGFHQDLHLLYQTQLSLNAEQGHFISNKEGKYLLSLVQSDQLVSDASICITLSLFYFFGLMLLTGYCIVRLRRLKPKNQLLYIGFLSILLIILRLVMLLFQVPPSLYSLQLFAPSLHASSFVFRSLGDYWLNALGIFLWAYLVGCYRINRTHLLNSKKRAVIILTLLMACTIALGIFAFGQIKSLVLNSSFSLQVHTGSGIEVYTIWAYAGAALLLSAVTMLIRSLAFNFQESITLSEFYKIWLILLVIASLIALAINRFIVLHLLFLSVLGIIQGAIRYRANRDFNYTLQIVVLILSAFYLTWLISIHATEKEQQIRSAKALSIMDSNAPVTKALLETMSSDWNKDNILLSLFQDPIANETQIKEYLRNKYFNKSWSHYNVQITICTQDDEIELPTANKAKVYNDCFIVFNELIQAASRIGNSSFYELTTYKGITPYVGMLSFITEQYGEVRLFIRLDLKPYEDEEGYPELLIGKQREAGFYGRYSFAKYVDNKLRYSNGTFDYYSIFDIFQKDTATQRTDNYFITVDGYNHYVFAATDSYKIIVSEEELSLYKKYIAFPYIFFLLFFIFLSIWSLETFPWYFFQLHSFRQQIKIALITMITIVFIVVGGASLYYSFTSNQSQYTNEHNAKIQMLRRELFNNLESPKDLDPNFNPQLEQRLKDYARILGADINIYDMFGVLLSTSQPDIFNKELLSNRMNYTALIELNSHETTEVTAQERIGNLEYSSVYVTLWNNKNEPIAYLNVPYFMKYKKFKAEMQDIIVGVLNINLLLIILALLVAFVISQRITSPLVMLQDKFSKIRVGRKNEKINYSHDDEIKVLVNAYNKMVDELEESTKLLTQSERESAWREMARQVAHEIKNPLTPMKLNIQFLQRNLMQHSENWEEQFQKSASMLLRQIDELSTIASAFSDFAKLPTIQNEKIDLITLLEELVMLYNKGEIKLQLSSNLENAFVYADHNRLRRAFINLITNAMQSIKNPHKGEVEVLVQQKQSHFIEVAVADNGKGISEEIRSKIFSPNFTTKTSGMGLGLALTKDIINQAHGIISFESEVGKGTIFRVTLPTLEYHL